MFLGGRGVAWKSARMRLSLIAVFVALCGCPAPSGVDGGVGGGGGTSTGGGAGGGGGAVTPITIAEYCSSLDSITCDYGTRCGLFDTRAGCDELLSQGGLGVSTCSFLRPSVNDGRIAFDGTAAGQCFRDAMSGCTQPTSCGDFFAGRYHWNDCSHLISRFRFVATIH